MFSNIFFFQKPDHRGERSRSLPRHYQQSRLSSSTLDLSEASYDYRKSVLYVTKVSLTIFLTSTMHQFSLQHFQKNKLSLIKRKEKWLELHIII